jgi:hypothetical protein
MKKTIIILSIIALTHLTGYSQTCNDNCITARQMPPEYCSLCDTIYNFVEVMPQYDKGDKELMSYLSNEVLSIFGKLTPEEAISLSTITFVLTIDCNGKVIDAIFKKSNSIEFYNKNLKEKFLTMAGWTAGKTKGQSVCCYYTIPLHIHWNV